MTVSELEAVDPLVAHACTLTQALSPEVRALFPWLPSSKSALLRACASGDLPAFKFQSRWLLDLAALRRLGGS